MRRDSKTTIRNKLKKYDEFIQFSLAACEQAFEQSGLAINKKETAERAIQYKISRLNF